MGGWVDGKASAWWKCSIAAWMSGHADEWVGAWLMLVAGLALEGVGVRFERALYKMHVRWEASGTTPPPHPPHTQGTGGGHIRCERCLPDLGGFKQVRAC